MNFIKKLYLVFKYDSELNEILKIKREEAENAKLEFEKDYLDLCIRHQQRSPGTHYADHNCDYCKALNRNH